MCRISCEGHALVMCHVIWKSSYFRTNMTHELEALRLVHAFELQNYRYALA